MAVDSVPDWKCMDIDNILEGFRGGPTLDTTLGMKFFSTSDPDTCMGRLAVDAFRGAQRRCHTGIGRDIGRVGLIGVVSGREIRGCECERQPCQGCIGRRRDYCRGAHSAPWPQVPCVEC